MIMFMDEVFEPELGQLVFGGASEQLPMQAHVQAGLLSLGYLIEELIDGVHNETSCGPASNIGPDYNHEGETFALRAYCWCDGAKPGHEDDCPPNFEHRPSGFRACWYKHVQRGASQNKKLSVAEWERMRAECVHELLTGGAAQSE